MKRLLLYALTTSYAKRAHLERLFGLHGMKVLRWSGFRGYPELQAERATESLKVGAEFVRAQFTRPFLLEDTEVRIEAYSQGSKISYPGFDVKRWWRVTSFAEIDAKCRQAGTRSVSQTSTLCLSIPGLEPYFFKGMVRGEIASSRYQGPDRPDAPWLNPREFGTIFIPQGCSVPFAALPVEESFRFDFRKRAVDQAVQKIEEINSLLNVEPSCYSLTGKDDECDGDQLTLFDTLSDDVSTEEDE